MRSRAARWTFVAVAWIALGASGYFLYTSQRSIASASAAVRAVDEYARQASEAIADVHVGQQAYVAAGQGVAFWMPKVAATTEAAATAVAGLRHSATSGDARSAADQASAALTEFGDVDKRARDYLRSSQALMAGDVIFTEGGQLASVAARQVEVARQAEHRTFDELESRLRRRQATVLTSAAGIAGFVVLLLAIGGGGTEAQTDESARLNAIASIASADEGIVSHAKIAAPAVTARPAAPAAAAGPPTPAAAPAPQAAAAARSGIVLKAAADLTTDFARVRDSEELSGLLARAADLIDASGLIVWMGTSAGSEMKPVLTHGYSPAMIARMPALARSADNAAAAAYRTSALQIVLSKPGGAAGAIVAPILGVDGCVGALSAEIKAGGEASEAVQAMTTIVAAQLAGVLSGASADTAATEEPKAAQG